MPRWLLLLHQFPTKPSAPRVSAWRRLQRLGAIPLRSAAHVLPDSIQSREDFTWLTAEIVAMAGQATVLAADAVERSTDEELVASFKAARVADYAALMKEVRALTTQVSKKPSRTHTAGAERAARACRERLAALAAVDYFPPPERRQVEAALAAAERRLFKAASPQQVAKPSLDSRQYTKRVWVTRPRPGIDRMASAWLIREFIDPSAEFTFADSASPQQVPFDMYQGEFTHANGLCTFEVLCRRFGLTDPVLARIGEIVHDVDLKDARYGPPEAATVSALVEGIRGLHTDDGVALAHGMSTFAALARSFAGTPDVGSRAPSRARPPRSKRALK